MPVVIIDLHLVMGARCDLPTDFGKMFAHRFEVDAGHDDGTTHTAFQAH